MNKTAAKHGFTLIELIIVTAMIAVIGLATIGIVRNSYDDWKLDSSRSALLQDGQAAVDQMARILRQAKGFYTVSDSTDQAGYITFKSIDGIIEEFRLNTGTDELEYGQPGNLSALTGAVTSLVFTCYDIDGNVLADPVQIGSVQSVQISATLTDSDDSSINFTYTSRVFCSTDYARRLVGHWKLDESSGITAADSGGYVNDGTLTNMNGNEWTGGILGGTLEFDGSNDYIIIADVDALSFGSGGTDSPFSVSAWVNATALVEYADIVCKIGATWEWELYLRNGRPAFQLYDPDDDYIGRYGNASIVSTGWHYLTATYDGSESSDGIQIFVDGEKLTATTTNDAGVYTGMPNSSAAVSIGSSTYDKYYFTGMIDDARIYNYALSAEEVAQLANILRYREFTEAKAGSDTTSITIDTPSGTSQDDLLIAAVATDGDTSSSLAPPDGEGWTEIDITAYSSDVTLGAWWKNADASESATHEFTWTGDEQAYGWMMRFTGHDTSDPIDYWAGNSGTSSTPASPAVTTTNEYTIVLRLGAFDDNDITENAPGLASHTAITMDTSEPVSKMYWYDGEVDKIQRANLDGSSIEDLVTAGVANIKAMALDTAGGKIYWADETIDKIQRANFDGSGVEDLVTAAIMKPRALALDIAGGKMYWADEQVLKIQRSNLDGSNIEDLVTTADLKAKVLALDIAGGKMYWGDETYDKIQRANLDGSDIEDLVTAAIMKPKALALDTAGGKMYWVDEQVFKIRRANLDGSSIEDLVTTAGLKAKCLALDTAGGKMYWGDETYDKIQRANLDGSDIEDLVTAAIMKPVALALDIVVAGSGDPASGGAGYVSQIDAGGSGTSTFSLTESEESRTLTIAISPAP
jgi:prepilin-type N-terminal cleavage/methylation domain-containing protein